jgi:hypothetical protein
LLLVENEPEKDEKSTARAVVVGESSTRLHVSRNLVVMQALLVGLAKQSTSHYTAHEDAD